MRSRVVGNSTSGSGSHGGGVYVSGGPLLVRDSEISGNTAVGANARGGGVYSKGNFSDATASIVNSTIAQNSAIHQGGGVFNGGGTAVIRHSTIAENSVTYNNQGGGVASLGSSAAGTWLSNTIVADNYADMGDANPGNDIDNDIDYVSGTYTNSFHSLGYNIVEHGTAVAYFNQAGDQIVDPMLGELGDNGGTLLNPTFTYALLPGSPAIDAGNPSFSPNSQTPALRSRRISAALYARVQRGIRIDIGAYEVLRWWRKRTSTVTAS